MTFYLEYNELECAKSKYLGEGMFDEQLVVSLFSILTLIGNMLLVCMVVAIVVVGKNKNKMFGSLLKLMNDWAFELALLVSLSAMLGSLLFSEVLLYEPCKLCWFQRIFMYPLVPILALAIGNKDRRVADYVLVLSSVGGLIALYQVMLQFSPGIPSTCGVDGVTASCTTNFFLSFGYITIPMMSLSAFLLIVVSMLAVLVYPNKKSLLERFVEGVLKK